jgi:hypothetical protein
MAFRHMALSVRLARAALICASVAAALGGCLAPPAPDDPRGWNHAAWCGTSPPSGYCIVPESHR